MKKYNYTGKTNLSFTHEKNDYLVHGPGPHELPEDAHIVKTHVKRGSLIALADTPENVTKIKNANEEK